tara:strand:- start:213 stop:530 length:318 start_codon:yes stop_codon:yes gene_type:complete
MNEYEKLATELRNSRHWIETLINVADNDLDATMSWYIPALTLDYHGYNMEPFWEVVDEIRPEYGNEEKTSYFIVYAQRIVDNLSTRESAAKDEMSYEAYVKRYPM